MRFGFFLREALRSMSRNTVPSFAAMASVLVTVLVLGVFIPVVQATTGAANEVRSKVLLDVYLKTDAKPRDAERVKALIARQPHVKDVQFVSKQAAYDRERKRNPEAYALLGSNPLPDTFRVTPDSPDNINKLLDELAPVVACTTGMKTPSTSSVTSTDAAAAKDGIALRLIERSDSRMKKPRPIA